MSSLLGSNIFTLLVFNLSIGENMMLLRSATILPVFWKIWSGCKFLAELPCCIAAGPDSSTKETNHKTRYKNMPCYPQLCIINSFCLFCYSTYHRQHAPWSTLTLHLMAHRCNFQNVTFSPHFPLITYWQGPFYFGVIVCFSYCSTWIECHSNVLDSLRKVFYYLPTLMCVHRKCGGFVSGEKTPLF